ncbi:UPF0236 family transposase-like protein [Clostridiisalibacter paucivorans]|uniref:UPF0236 family transposase-like protein n=1 Tax=Clostridiisalibacter paucivorans TaxID=408753 RepID=UPI000479D294|nr:UPF0236 family protein [Clostridiisalibacter paucivorans]
MANHKDISEFILNTEKMLNDIGIQIVQKTLKTMDCLVKQDNLRKEKSTVQRKADKKNIATIFGEVNYKRTYYKNKKTGEYKYLSDQRLGIDIHDRLDSSLKAKLVDEAIESSHRKSGQITVDSIYLTNQTVMNTIRELGDIANNSVNITQKRK